jgi:hypothetical protein
MKDINQLEIFCYNITHITNINFIHICIKFNLKFSNENSIMYIIKYERN